MNLTQLDMGITSTILGGLAMLSAKTVFSQSLKSSIVIGAIVGVAYYFVATSAASVIPKAP